MGGSNEYKHMVNPLSNFFTSYYESPREMDLYRFIDHFVTSSEVLQDDNSYHVEQFEELKKLPNFPYKHARQIKNNMYEIIKKPVKPIDDIIKNYMGISLNDLIYTDHIYYLEKYHAFYVLGGGSAAGYFNCQSGEINGDTISLYSDHSILTLKEEDGEYFIFSHTELEQ